MPSATEGGDRRVPGGAEATFLVQAHGTEQAESAAAALYTIAYGRPPAEDLTELISVRVVV